MTSRVKQNNNTQYLHQILRLMDFFPTVTFYQFMLSLGIELLYIFFFSVSYKNNGIFMKYLSRVLSVFADGVLARQDLRSIFKGYF